LAGTFALNVASASPEEAKAEFQKCWDGWKALTKIMLPPVRVPTNVIALLNGTGMSNWRNVLAGIALAAVLFAPPGIKAAQEQVQATSGRAWARIAHAI
jgi:hypothetical protein